MTKLQYKDYTGWEKEMLHSDAMNLHKEYWLEQFKEEIPILNLPTDFLRPNLQSFEGETLFFKADKQLSKAIKELGNNNNTTLYMTLLSAFTVLLAKYSGQEDIIVGSPTAGRQHTDLQDIVGMFVNTLAMRNFPNGRKTFLQFLQEVKEHTIKSFEHQDYPFDELVENLNLKRDLSRNVLFDVMFVLQNMEEKELEFDNLEFEILEFENNVSQFDITLTASENMEEIEFKFEYCTKLFKKTTIEKMKLHFLNILKEVTKNPEIKISEINILSENERTELLIDFNATRKEYSKDKTIIDLFEAQAEKYPRKTAVISGEKKLNYGELNAKANQIAIKLRKRGIKPDDIVGIMVERSFEMIIGIMGILKSGGAYLPIDPEYPKDRIQYMLEDSKTKILLTQKCFISKINFTGIVIDLNDNSLYTGNTDNVQKVNNFENLAYVIYTSGSTGKPKGVMIEHAALYNRLNWMQNKYPIGMEDVILQKTPFTFDVSVWELLWWSAQGSTLCLLEPGGQKYPEVIIDAVCKYHVSVIHFVPSMFHIVLEYIKSENRAVELSSLKRIFASGEELKKEQVQRFNQIFEKNNTSLHNLYGPTEAAIDVTYFDCLKHNQIEQIPIGKPIDNIKLYILNQYKQLNPIGVPGELCISGDGLARGYLNQKELTEAKFVQNPLEPQERMYHTGDLARWLPDGNIEFMGRMDHQVKIRGFRIELGEIESRLLSKKAIKEAVVIIKTDKKNMKFLCAYLVSEEELNVADLREYLLEELPDYMVPANFIKIEQMPLTSNGKIDRKKLQELSNTIYSGNSYVGPSNKEEEKLVEIWSDVLGIPKESIGVKDSFWEAGGDSIRAISVISAINKHFSTQTELSLLYQIPTIEGFAKYLLTNHPDNTRIKNQKAEEEIERLKHKAMTDCNWQESLLTEIEDIYPMSDIQLGMIYHSLKEEEQAVYHDQFEYQLSIKDFDDALFKKAVSLMILKHQMLRTGFEINQKEMPVQIVYKNSVPDMEYFDIKILNRADKENYIKKFLAEDRINQFDITKPLWRLRIFQLDEETISLVIIFHHAILDGWSVASFLTELLNVYVLLKLDRNYIPVKLKHSYRDYIIEQINVDNNEEIKNYWQEELKDYKRFAFYPERNDSVKFISRTYPIDGELLQNLKKTAKNLNVSIRTLCFSAYLYMLNMVSYHDDILVGLVENNRPVCDDGDKILGCFLNTIPVRVQFHKIRTWADMVQVVEEKIVSLKKYGRLSLQKIANAIGEKTYEGNPIFDLLFNYIDFHIFNNVIDKEIGEVKDRINVEGYESINTMFNFTINNTFGQMHIDFKYSENILSKNQADKYVIYFTRILNMLYKNPDSSLNKFDILTYDERDKILFKFNSNIAGYPQQMTLVELFEKRAAKNSKNIALIYGEEKITYQELNGRANQLGRVLRDNGVCSDMIIGIMAERSVLMIISMLAVLKAGGAYMPIDPDYPKERIQYMLKDSGTPILLTQEKFIENVDFGVTLINIEEKQILDYSDANMVLVNQPDDLAYIIYTSGTTGTPKGVMIEHRNVIRLLINDKFQFQFDETDIWTMFHSYCFDFSVWEMYGALLYGSKLIIVPKITAKDPVDYLQLLKKHNVTVLNITPTAFYNISIEEMKNPHRNLNLKYVIFGGEALKPGMLKSWKEKYPQIHFINMFGITETTVHATYKEISDYEIGHNISNIGKSIPTLCCYVMDCKKELMPIGSAGELYVGGMGVARGYLNRKQLTEERFVRNPFNSSDRLYKSGDLVRLLENGDMEYLGRIDKQVKIRGHRIELGEIEHQLLKHEDINEAVVLLNEINKDNCLVAYLVTKVPLSIMDIKKYLSKSLPDYMIPAYFYNLESIPQTPNGKTDDKYLMKLGKEKAFAELQTGNGYEAPKNDIEKTIAKIWSELLGIKNIGINDNFFDLGGDSIKVISIISRINQAFHSNLKIKDLYENETIRLISAAINIGAVSELNKNRITGNKYIENFCYQILKENEVINKLPNKFETIYPLSKIQHGMVLYSQLDPGLPVYHDQYTYQFSIKDFKEEEFKQALKLVMQRHSILRTIFDLQDFSQPVQIVLEEAELKFNLTDFQNLTETEQKIQIEQYMKNDLNNPFLFNHEIMWRIKLFRLNDHNYFMILSSHHAVLDGWSKTVFDYDLFQIYRNLVNKKEYKPSALKASYKDFVAIELGKEESDETKLFWKNKLDGYHRNKLPFCLISNKTANINTARKIEMHLDRINLQRLESSGKYYESTLKEICFSAYLYLYRIITGEKDIVTGIVTHSRPEIEDADKMLGCFLNTIPVRIRVDTILNKKEFINVIKAYLHTVKKHEIFLSSIAEAIGEQSSTANPIFDTLFNYVDFHILNQMSLEGVLEKTTNEMDLEANEMTNTLFDLEVSKASDELIISIKYSTQLFLEEDIKNTLNLYKKILEEFCSVNNELISINQLLTEEEKNKILYGFNNTQKPYSKDKCIYALLEEQAVKTPGHIAVIQNKERITYKDLNDKANMLARILIENDVKNGDNVGLITKRNIKMVIGMYAILKAGAAYVPIDWEYPETRKQFIWNHSNVTVLVTDEDYNLDFHKVVVINYEEMKKQNSNNLCIQKSARDLAYIIYTSGSTGLPKGVMIEHHSVINLVAWVNSQFQINERDRMLSVTSMCFDLSVYDIFGVLGAGGSIVIASGDIVKEPNRLLKLLKDEKITLWNSVPSTMNYLIHHLEENKGYQQSELRLALLSGDWIPVELAGRMKKYFENVKVISLGGATEGTVWSIFHPIENVVKGQKRIPYGKPIDNNYFYILDENKNIVPRGVIGELYIGGAGVARGYINNEEKDKKAFSKNIFLNNTNEKMYRTGDYGRFLPNGEIEFLGRIDNQVKIRGYRVELGEIETHILSDNQVKDTVVTVKEDENGTKFICAYLVAESKLDIGQLRKEIAKELPEYMIPTYFIQLEKIPLTANGKIDRNALPKPETAIITNREYEKPTNQTEKKLADIWKEILKISEISIHDNFFEIGGHSLRATSLAHKIHKEMNVEIPLKEIFAHNTIKSLALYIDSLEEEMYETIELAEKKEFYEISYAQETFYWLSQSADIGTSYNMPIIVEVEGKLNVDKFVKAVKELINRQEVFRTSFEIVDEKPVQIIRKQIDFEVGVTEINNNDWQDKIKNFIKPFQLNQAPLFRVELLKQKENKFIIMADMHHIISDGASINILINDFKNLYEGNCLPELKIQYKDYSIWQRRKIETGSMKKKQNYWLEKLKGELPVLNLPFDYQRPLIQSFEGDEVYFEITGELKEQIERLAAQTDTTLYMILLSAFNILLSKFTGQEDIIVGTATFGREHMDLYNLIGMFSNTIIMRNYPKNNMTVIDFIKSVKINALEAFENQEYQFGNLVGDLGVYQSKSKNPVFDVAFFQQNIELDQLKIENLSFKPYKYESAVSKFDLTLIANESRNNILFTFEYCTRLFKRDTIELFIKYYKTLLEQMIKHSSNLIYEIDGIDTVKMMQLMNRKKNIKAESFMVRTIKEMFEEQVKASPDNIAIKYNNDCLTYQELNKKANQIARFLKEQGVQKQDKIYLSAKCKIEFIYAILGIIKVEGICVLSEENKNEEELEQIKIQDNVTHILKIEKESIDYVSDFTEVKLEWSDLNKYSAKDLKSIEKAADLVFIIYPENSCQAIRLNNRSICNYILQKINEFELNKDSILCGNLKQYFVSSITQIFTSFYIGAVLIIYDDDIYLDSYQLFQKISDDKVNLLEINLYQLKTYLNIVDAGRKKIKLPDLNYIILSDKLVGAQIIEKFYMEYNIRLVKSYCFNECLEKSFYHKISMQDNYKPNRIGSSQKNYNIYILDLYKRLTAPLAVGELYMVMDEFSSFGYNDLNLQQERFIENPYNPEEILFKTGDMVKLLLNGDIEYIGKKNEMLEKNGCKIYTEQIKERLLSNKKIKDAVVLVKQDENQKAYLCCYIVSTSQLNNNELNEMFVHVQEGLGLVVKILKIDKIPFNSNGKIDEAALAEIDCKADTELDRFIEAGDIETQLIALWKDILEIEELGKEDDFFELGGNSIRAIKLEVELEKLGYSINEIGLILNYRTISKLSEYLKTLNK